MAKKKIGVLLSGCGVRDGSEIHEAVLTLLALDRAGVEIVCMAPDIEQAKVVNHLSGEATGEKRNVLVESARIARGEIRNLATVRASELDGLALPGGFGAALNLSSFAKDGPDCVVSPEVARILREVHAAKKPILAICIAPATVARVLGEVGVRVTIGTDAGTASAIERMGATHEACPVEGCVVDREHRLVTSPAYMLGTRISDVAVGIDRAVGELLALV